MKLKPEVSPKMSEPIEPTLDFKSYNEILKRLNDSGKNLERLPEVYFGRKEEGLRDHFVSILDPNLDLGSVSGETFNKSGKTDILYRYDSSVVFIAECKVWKGKKQLLEAINQLLSYLTWRDSKTSLIIFVKQKAISSIIDSYFICYCRANACFILIHYRNCINSHALNIRLQTKYLCVISYITV